MDIHTHTPSEAATMVVLSREEGFPLVLVLFYWKYPEFVTNQAMILLILDWAA